VPHAAEWVAGRYRPSAWQVEAKDYRLVFQTAGPGQGSEPCLQRAAALLALAAAATLTAGTLP
jgi:hypothetical protein